MRLSHANVALLWHLPCIFLFFHEAGAIGASDNRAFDVIHYAARIEPDIYAGSLVGQVQLDIAVIGKEKAEIELNSGELLVDKVSINRQPWAFSQENHRLVFEIPDSSKTMGKYQIDIKYHGYPSSGMQIIPQRAQLYTIFSTSNWLVCVDAPDDRATLDLSVVLPKELRMIGNGRLVSRRAVGTEKVVYRWKESKPVPTYTFGFAAGRFTQVTEQRSGKLFQYVGDGFLPSELRQIFRDSGEMLKFYENKAGVRYDGTSYTQVLVEQTAGQEMSDFAILSEAYARGILAGENDEVLAAHELAHQWWGNMVTCRDWRHFWLNEGFATFMAAAFMEYRFGKETYSKLIERSRQRYEKAKGNIGDRSLVYAEWRSPTADDRALVYHKGAYVLHLLRQRLGDEVFWKGIRIYTRQNFGKSVVTDDFKRAMEYVSGQDLSDFFDLWIFNNRLHLL